jgi:RNase P subunit RPR2
MKIIKEGKIPSERLYRTTCRHCKTVFEFLESEGNVRYYRDGNYVEIICPICNIICNVTRK